MADKFHRLFRILQLIPRQPKSVDSESIARALESEGIDVERRTLQRDLVRLERMGLGIHCVDNNKPYRWSFAKDARALLVPGLDPQTALALRLVEVHLERLVPRSTLKALQPHLQAARATLEHKPVAKWLDKVRLISRHQPLVPPKVNGAVAGVVHEALFEGKQLEVHYRRPDGKEQDLTLHPLGLAYRDAIAYLVATAYDYDDVRIYALHRMQDATLLEARARARDGFELDAFIAQGGLGFPIADEDVELELVFEEAAAKVVEETPLSEHQRMTPLEDGRVRVEARVPETQVLRAWILGFGAGVEVKRPASLRKAIAKAHEQALARYR